MADTRRIRILDISLILKIVLNKFRTSNSQLLLFCKDQNHIAILVHAYILILTVFEIITDKCYAIYLRDNFSNFKIFVGRISGLSQWCVVIVGSQIRSIVVKYVSALK